MVARFPATELAQLPKAYFAVLDQQIAATRAAGVDVIDLSKGDPDIPTPEYIVKAMQTAVADPANHGYPAYRPSPDVAEAISYRYRSDYHVDIDRESQVAVFNGAHEPLVAIPYTFLDQTDALVIPEPYYPAYPDVARLAGREYISLPLDPENNFQPDFDAVSPEDWSRAGVLLLNYPHNPTGALARRETFARALELAQEFGLLVVNDFAYAALGFDGERPLSLLEVDPEAKYSIEIQTMSKTYSMAGWRFGYVVGNTQAVAALTQYRAHGFATVNSALQQASAAALLGDQSPTVQIREIYEHRRDTLVAGLNDAGFKVAPVEGSFFVWVYIGGDTAAFAAKLLAAVGVAVAPGEGFGDRGTGWIRIALVHDTETLTSAVRRLTQFVQESE